MHNSNLKSKNDSHISESIYTIVLNISFYFFIIYAGIIVPLYIRNSYYDILEAKAYIFDKVTLLLQSLYVLCIIFKILSKKIQINKDPLLICIILFLIFSFISTIQSYSPLQAYTGEQGWYIGFKTISILILSILVLKDKQTVNNKIFYPILITISFILLLAIFDEFELDILNLRKEIYYESYHKFLTTIGNINWYTGYLSLIVPFFICIFLNESKKINIYIYGFISILGVINIAFIGSDGIYLALGVMSFFFIPFVFNDKLKIKRFSYLLLIYSISLIISRKLNYLMDGYCLYTRKLYVIVPCLIISIILFVFSTMISNEQYSKIRKKFIISLEFTLVLCLIFFIIFTALNNNVEWATGRLEIWDYSLKRFSSFPFIKKLFGLGPELLGNVYSSISSFDKDGGIIVTSHSEPIQLLLTMGILGLLSWLSFYICLIVYFIKEKAWTNNKLIPFFICLIAYFGQSFVNSATTTNVCTLTLIIILFFINKKLYL